MAENYVGREEAENIVRTAIVDYLDIETLQQIVDLIYGDEFIVVEEVTTDEMDYS
jgi:hypothetical protein